MSLQHQIKQAYDNVHAPEDFTERLRQQLYEGDHRAEAESLTCEAVEAPKHRPLRIMTQAMAFLAASLVLCAGCGLAVWSLRDKVNEFHPGANVSAPAPESGMLTVPDVTGLTKEEAVQVLARQGFQMSYCYEESEASADGTVFRTEPAFGTHVSEGSQIMLYIARSGE